MNSRRRYRGHRAGFALVETLVALVLLAAGLGGAASAMIRGQAELRATLLATRASDLAGDLAEQLRAQRPSTGLDTLLAGWERKVGTGLSAGVSAGVARGQLLELPDAGLPSSHEVSILWWDPAMRAPRRLQLPVLLSVEEQP